MDRNTTIGAIILTGGKSSRMGSDKGLAELKGKTLIEHIINVLKPITSDIIIIANNPNYNFLGYKVYNDIIKECGPLGGIYTGLTYSNRELNIILSCDIPFVSTPLLEFLIKNSGSEDILVPEHNGQTEPLCGIYRKNCINEFKRLLDNNEFKLHNMLNQLNSKRIDVSQQNFFDSNLFMNINTKDQLNIAGGKIS